MGEIPGNNGFIVNENGEIVRSRKCPECGRDLFSEGDYCEFCGAKLRLKVSFQNNGEKTIWYDRLIVPFVLVFWMIFVVLFIVKFLFG